MGFFFHHAVCPPAVAINAVHWSFVQAELFAAVIEVIFVGVAGYTVFVILRGGLLGTDY
jgi:hypothetical protein